MNTPTYTTALVWFRNDLRTRDHEALFRASSEATSVIPVYCLDPRHIGQHATTARGFQKTGTFRTQFLLESLADLRSRLQTLGADLLIVRGHPEEVLPEIAQTLGAQALYYHEEATDEELRVEDALQAACKAVNIRVHNFWGATLYHPDDLPFSLDNLPDVFTQFRKLVEKSSHIRPTFPEPSALRFADGVAQCLHDVVPLVSTLPSVYELCGKQPTIDGRAVLPFAGGQTAAWQRLEVYMWEGNHLKNYKETRNGLLGADYSSKFSAWLAAGCLSPRSVYEEVRRYERERVKNDSTYWLVFELLWRDFFRFVAFAYGNSLFFDGGIKGERKSWTYNAELFERWKCGTTGIPFIDANMRELAATGFMSNRGRQNVASFLVRDLNIHWLWGAEYFESVLIDYDVCSNYGNWNYAAGIGNDPREDRYFNIIRQASMYDPKGEYVKHWLPELKTLPTQYIHEPHKLSHGEQEKFGVRLGVDYPHPVVDLEKSAKRFQRG